MALLQFGTTLVFAVPPLWQNPNQPDPNLRKAQAIMGKESVVYCHFHSAYYSFCHLHLLSCHHFCRTKYTVDALSMPFVSRVQSVSYSSSSSIITSTHFIPHQKLINSSPISYFKISQYLEKNRVEDLTLPSWRPRHDSYTDNGLRNCALCTPSVPPDPRARTPLPS